MALIKCSECGNEVSEQANSCPKCGAPIKTERHEVHTNMTMKEETQRMKEQDASFCTLMNVLTVASLLCILLGVVFAGIFIIIAGIIMLLLGVAYRSKGYPKNGNACIIASLICVLYFILQVVFIAKMML